MKSRWIVILIIGMIPGLGSRAAEYSCYDRIPRPRHDIYFKTMPAIALDGGDRVFAADNRDHALYVLSALSDEARKIAGRGQGPGELQYPNEVQADKNLVYVLDQSGISIFSGEGIFQKRFRIDGQVVSLAAGGDTIFVARTGVDGLVQTFSPSGTPGKAFGSAYDFPRSLYKDYPENFVEFLISAGTILVGEKAVYFVSSLFDEIQVFDQEGTFLKRVSFGGEEAEKNRKYFFETGQKTNSQTFVTNPLIVDACCRNGQIYFLHRSEKNPANSEIWTIRESDLKQVKKIPLRDSGADIQFDSCRSMAIGGSPSAPTVYVSLRDEKSSDVVICLFREK